MDRLVVQASLVLLALAGAIPADADPDLGDGGPALEATLGYPAGLAVDHENGVVFIADADQGRVRRVDLATHTITTVAGTGTGGWPPAPDAGDGGPALDAELSFPHALAIGHDGALYVATYQRIRRIDADGMISTVAGGVPCCAQEEGLPGAGTYIATARDVAIDGEGLVLYSDFGLDPYGREGMIRRIEADGTVHTIEQDLGEPLGLAFDADDNLYFTEYLGFAVWKRTPQGVKHRLLGLVCSCYSDGPAPLVGVRKPTSVDVGPSGEVFFIDESLVEPRLRRVIHPLGQPASSVAGDVETILSRPALGALAAWDPPGGIGRGASYALKLFVVEGDRVFLLDHRGLHPFAGR